ncbi:glutathione-dependent formaldehyde-activating enzyme [Xylaria venustula]|nr:glutathione-dependent formaldehyde-activating enzyme [Xylaria venustula]
MSDQEKSLKTYRANCHCAAYVYEVTLPEVTTASQCNCSICYKKGAIWVFPKPDGVKFVKGDPAALKNYTFGKKAFTHKSCSTCGNSVMFVGHLESAKPNEDHEIETGINIRLFQHGQIDSWKLPLIKFDGASLFQPAYEAPKFTGKEPTAEIEGGKLYTGSCHCGAITVALKSKPLDESFTDDIGFGFLECNCSSCARAGYVWTYPKKTQVVIEGIENLGMYTFGRKTAGKTFCKICNVPIHNEVLKFTEEELATKTEKEREYILGGQSFAPVNLRIINNFDVNDLNVRQFDGYSEHQPAYVEP